MATPPLTVSLLPGVTVPIPTLPVDVAKYVSPVTVNDPMDKGSRPQCQAVNFQAVDIHIVQICRPVNFQIVLDKGISGSNGIFRSVPLVVTHITKSAKWLSRYPHCRWNLSGQHQYWKNFRQSTRCCHYWNPIGPGCPRHRPRRAKKAAKTKIKGIFY